MSQQQHTHSTTNHSDWEPPTAGKAFFRMRRLLHGKNKFQLILCQYNDPLYRDWTVEEIELISPKSHTLRLDKEVLGDFGLFELTLQNMPEDVVQIIGLERWSQFGDMLHLFRGFNYHREALAELQKTMVVWLPEHLMNQFLLEAPDMWAWRSAVLLFEVPPNLAVGNFEPLLHYTPAPPDEARERLDVVKGLLAKHTTPNLLLEAGRLSIGLDLWEVAESLLQQCVELSETHEEPIYLTTALFWLGRIRLHQNKPEDALKLGQRALKQAVSILHWDGVAQLLGLLAPAHRRCGECDEAQTLCSHFMEREPSRPKLVTAALYQLANLEIERGQPQLALEHLEKALSLARESRELNFEAVLVYRSGVVHALQGNAFAAGDYFQQSLDLAVQADHPIVLVLSKQALAVVDRQRGRHLPPPSLIAGGNPVASHPKVRKSLGDGAEIFLSCAGSESPFISTLIQDLESTEISVVRDRSDGLFQGLLPNFLKELGPQRAVVVVIDQAWLRCENCLWEWIQIVEARDVWDWVVPLVLEKYLFKARSRLGYLRFWEDKMAELNQEIMSLDSSANLQGILQVMDLYTQIRAQLDTIPDVLREMNVLTDLEEPAQVVIALRGRVGRTEAISQGGNPFDPWTPALPPFFVGRDEEMRRLEAAMNNKQSVSLIGDWRIGKTSLLRTWRERLDQMGRKAVLLDGQKGEASSISAFVQAVTGRRTSDEADSAADVLSAWAESFGGEPPVILVDEFESIIRRFEPRFLERLRGLMGRVLFVLVTRREMDLIYEDFDRTSPFYNLLQNIWVGLLEEKDARTLLQKGRTWLKSRDEDYLLEQAGGHPFFLQLLSKHLVDARMGFTTEEKAKDAFIMEAMSRLRDLWRTLTPRDRERLLALGPEGSTSRAQFRARGLTNREGFPFGKVFARFLEEEV